MKSVSGQFRAVNSPSRHGQHGQASIVSRAGMAGIGGCMCLPNMVGQKIVSCQAGNCRVTFEARC